MTQTAVNPQTGERLHLVNNQWVPAGGRASAPAAPRPTAQRQQIRFRDDADAVARTMLGEAANQGEQGMLAVGGVIANRARQRGKSASDVVLERNQFEPWGNAQTTQRLLGISDQSPEYQRAYSLAQRALGGEDVTGGASHFYAPKAQAALGRAKPSWDNGTGRAIGDHLFFNLDGAPTSDAQLIGAPQEQAAPQYAVNPQTGERLTLEGGQWVPAERSQAELADLAAQRRFDNRGSMPSIGETLQSPWLQRDITRYMERNTEIGPNGEIELDTPSVIRNRTREGQIEIYDEDSGAYYDATPKDLEQYEANTRQSEKDRAARRARLEDPEYQLAIEDARGRSENVNDQARAFAQGGTLGFMDEILGASQYVRQGLENLGQDNPRISAAMAARAAMDSERDAQNRFAAENPYQNLGLQVAGGFVTPGIGAAGRFIEAGAGSQRIARAAGVGAGYGAASGVGMGEGNLLERADDAAIGAATGAGVGAVGQAGLNRLARAGEGGGAARRLSRAGVDLTPGQMMAEVPVIGSTVRYAEDVLGGYNPLMTGVRQRQNEDVVRAAGQEALDAIGETLPRGARTGREVYTTARQALSQRYDEVTDRITAVLDDDFDLMMDNMRRQADQVLDGEHAARFNRILDDNVLSEVGADGALSGDSFKRIETTLRQQSERARRPTSTLQDGDFADALDDARNVFRDVIARQFPDEAEAIRGLNMGWAVNSRIRRAVSGSAGFGREGTPTPGELSQSVRQLSSEDQIAQDRGLLQGLAQDARTVLPATVGDTGSGQRAVIGGAIGAIGTGAVATINPALAGMIATGAVVYSRPGIAALNALYRATDSRAANEIVRRLGEQAKQNPALVPYYEAAAQHVLNPVLPDRQASQPAPQPAQQTSPALQRVLQ